MKADLLPYDLQGEEIVSLLTQAQNKKLTHAILITGEKGTGKKTLAGLIAQTVLCKTEGIPPCGHCIDCRMSESLDHPDLIVIQQGVPIATDVKKGRSTIPVDDIREMIRICSTSTMNGSSRVVIVYDADKMTVQAQNCLLKTLEEPPENTYMLLTTEHPEGVLTTVASRARPVRLKAWPDEYVFKFLCAKGIEQKRAKDATKEARGSIGRAYELATNEDYWEMRRGIIKDFFGTLKRSEILRIDRKDESENLFEILESIIQMMLDDRFQPEKAGETCQIPLNWQRFTREAEPERFIALLKSISNARRQVQANVNFQVIVEQLLFVLMGEGNQWSA